MVDAQAIGLPLCHELHHAPVGGREDVLALGTQAGEVVDVEEAPVVDVVRREAPEREPVGLSGQQLVERVEAARIAGRAVDRGEVRLDVTYGRRHLRA